ncbi:hypothetical protein ACFQVA_07295 [Actinomadura keratinilytica]
MPLAELARRAGTSVATVGRAGAAAGGQRPVRAAVQPRPAAHRLARLGGLLRLGPGRAPRRGHRLPAHPARTTAVHRHRRAAQPDPRRVAARRPRGAHPGGPSRPGTGPLALPRRRPGDGAAHREERRPGPRPAGPEPARRTDGASGSPHLTRRQPR